MIRCLGMTLNPTSQPISLKDLPTTHKHSCCSFQGRYTPAPCPPPLLIHFITSTETILKGTTVKYNNQKGLRRTLLIFQRHLFLPFHLFPISPEYQKPILPKKLKLRFGCPFYMTLPSKMSREAKSTFYLKVRERATTRKGTHKPGRESPQIH